MKKDRQPSEEEMRPEYRREDLGKGVRGKYFKLYSEGTSFKVAASYIQDRLKDKEPPGDK